MAAVITVMNMKGGVGKTTVAMHLGGMLARYEFAKKRRNVLLIDYDPQFNLSQAFIAAKDYFALEAARKTTIAVLIDDDTNLDPYRIQVAGNLKPPAVSDLVHRIFTYADKRLDIIASTLDLMYVALSEIGSKTAAVEERFYTFIDECRSIYDVIIIDCHPAGSLFTKTALRCSDHVLIPVLPQRYSVRGIGLMTQFISAKRAGHQAPTPHILFNSTSRIWSSREESSIRADPRFQNLCVGETLKWYKAFSEPEEGKGFVWGSRKPYSTQAFQNLQNVSNELVSRLNI